MSAPPPFSTNPIDQMRRVLMGYQPLEEAPESIQSWARFFIHQGAMEILAMETKEERREALNKLPPLIRPHIEAEIKRVWALLPKED